MPLTLPTHPIAVIPLKLWRPRWFDGVALVLGATAPDIAYAADGYGLNLHSHAWHAPLWWALPLTLVLTRLVRWAAPTVAAHLPAGGPLAVRDYGALTAVRHPWWVTTVSALVGAASHIGWDALTHPRIDGDRVLFRWLLDEAVSGLPWWDLLSALSDLTGLAAGPALAVHVGYRRLLRRWHGLPPPVSTRPVTFWLTACAVVAAGLAVLPLQPVRALYSQAIRSMLIAGLALLAGTVAVRLRAAPRRRRVRSTGAGSPG